MYVQHHSAHYNVTDLEADKNTTRKIFDSLDFIFVLAEETRTASHSDSLFGMSDTTTSVAAADAASAVKPKRQTKALKVRKGSKKPKKVPVNGVGEIAPDGKGKSKRRRPRRSFGVYLHKILQQVHPGLTISKKSMEILDNFSNDLFERLATEGGRLIRYNKRSTLTSREIQTATRLILSGELAKHAVAEGTKAVTKFTTSAF